SVSTPKRKTDVDSNTTRSVSTPKRKTDVDSNTTRSVSTPKRKNDSLGEGQEDPQTGEGTKPPLRFGENPALGVFFTF
ncbi:MAG: hypothetical protein AB1391_02900, partial [Candidatus Micrarchaeota archaeon]